mmetsp:Transcript_14166/g.18560  ORF Transcript_14166/g.18560 Transcript_14166/m.18560 type:complete len:259 (-) Transcript_14166:962-1738(-)
MSNKQKRPWQAKRSKARRDEKFASQNLVHIPEPVHRIAHDGSGISLRFRRTPNLEDIRRVCEAYEKKCAGKYSHKTLAARYLYQLSREVQFITLQLEKTEKSNRDRISYLEECLSEWEENFGPIKSLPKTQDRRNKENDPNVGSQEEERDREFRLMTPNAVKKLIDDQASEILKLRKEASKNWLHVAAEKRKYEQELSEFFDLTRDEYRMEIKRLKVLTEAKIKRVEESYEDQLLQEKRKNKRKSPGPRRPKKKREWR